MSSETRVSGGMKSFSIGSGIGDWVWRSCRCRVSGVRERSGEVEKWEIGDWDLGDGRREERIGRFRGLGFRAESGNLRVR